jgi:hypothetical protein
MRFSRLDLEHAFSAVPFIAVGATGAPRAAPADEHDHRCDVESKHGVVGRGGVDVLSVRPCETVGCRWLLARSLVSRGGGFASGGDPR